MAKSRLPGRVHPPLPSLFPSSSANLEGVQTLSDDGGKLSAGLVHTTSSHSSVVPPSVLEESHSCKVDSKSEHGEEEEDGVEKRHGTGTNRELFTAFTSIVVKWPQGRILVSPPSVQADFSTRFCPAEHRQSTPSSKEAVGELDTSPVSRAIARHLGIDISAEGRAAQNRRGIVVIVHGAPLTGR